MYNFLAWVAGQGIKHIPKKFLIQAFNSFKKLPGNQVILKTAKNLWDDVIKKTSTKDLTKQIRQKIKPVQKPGPFQGWPEGGPKIVKTKIAPKKLPLPKEYVIKNLKKGLPNWKFKKVPPSQKGKVINLAKEKAKRTAEAIIKKGDWDPSGMKGGGSVDKALPKKSRDI